MTLNQDIERIWDQFALTQWTQAFKCYEQLQKHYKDAASVLEQEGHANFLIRGFVEIWNTIEENWKTASELRRFYQSLQKVKSASADDQEMSREISAAELCGTIQIFERPQKAVSLPLSIR
jgi:hypothetical protein